MSVRVCRDPAALFEVAAALFEEMAVTAVEARGSFAVALSGGSTPRGLYERLAGDAALRNRVPWTEIDWWWSDERHVPPDSPESNYRLAADTLLSRVPVTPWRVHRYRAEDPDARRVAREYEFAIRCGFPSPPRFDLVLLGLGPDGHTASLFPGTAALAEREQLVVANDVPALKTVRLTFTLPLINDARAVIFLVAGEDKRTILASVLNGPARVLPAQLVEPVDGELIWVVDAAAARGLPDAS